MKKKTTKKVRYSIEVDENYTKSVKADIESNGIKVKYGGGRAGDELVLEGTLDQIMEWCDHNPYDDFEFDRHSLIFIDEKTKLETFAELDNMKKLFCVVVTDPQQLVGLDSPIIYHVRHESWQKAEDFVKDRLVQDYEYYIETVEDLDMFTFEVKETDILEA